MSAEAKPEKVPNLDWILIEELECRAHVGVPDEERKRRQKLLVDLELGLDLRKAGKNDRVEDTVDYASAARAVRRFIEDGSFQLVEAVAEGAAALLLERFPIKEARVRVRKFSVPGTRSVGVSVSRDLEIRNGAASSSRSHGMKRS